VSKKRKIGKGNHNEIDRPLVFIAERVDDTSGVYFVTAFSGLFAPYWRDDARGTMLGK
jgi:glycerol kinase